MKTEKNYRRLLLTILLVALGVIIYAYGFEVTDVSLAEMQEERRQINFVRILRALAHPDIFQYEKEEVAINQPFYIACQPGVTLPEPDTSGPYLVANPPCADPSTEITVQGFNFPPGAVGPINLIPPSGVTLQLGNYQANQSGEFSTTVRLPRRNPTPEVQYLRAITRTNVGAPRLSRNGRETFNKIIETVFLALLATTLGTALAIPVSFLAARNIMRDVTSPAASIALSLLGWPVGIGLGVLAMRWLSSLSGLLTRNAWVSLAGLVVSLLLAWLVLRWAVPQEEVTPPTASVRWARRGGLLLAALASILGALLLANLATVIGSEAELGLGSLGFLGGFLADLGDIITAITALVIALMAGAIVGGWGGRLGQSLTEHLPAGTLKLTNLVLAALAGAAVAVAIGAVIEWFYQLGNPTATYLIPAGVGALLGFVIALRAAPKESLPVGMTIYYVVRTILNTLRAIEAFIWAIIFVVLLSTGPFAGVMALSLHTIAALAKLFSEQVESISPGPMEAVKATGANRLQTIIYAVIPQIVPPYISFTMYRWDINVRMSTIIGFVGGGGIGFLLQQNINLLNYRAASAQMLAITIVVAAMDYISSALRERFV